MKIEADHTLERFLRQLQRAPSAIMRHVDQAVQRAAILGARDAKRAAPKSLSELANSIRNEQLGLAFHRVLADAPHARHVEEGTGPGGSPPLDILRAWIRTAQIQPREARNVRDLAFLIQRKIRRTGTPAQPYMAPQVDTSRARLLRMLPQAIRQGAEEAAL
ncbi:MAG: HK97 gp10 family phage protein [Wenzhouxiangella sp.]